jgi:hypothetical protein
MAKTTNRLTEFEKARIIAGYEAETPVSMIAKVLGGQINHCDILLFQIYEKFRITRKIEGV